MPANGFSHGSQVRPGWRVATVRYASNDPDELHCTSDGQILIIYNSISYRHDHVKRAVYGWHHACSNYSIGNAATNCATTGMSYNIHSFIHSFIRMQGWKT